MHAGADAGLIEKVHRDLFDHAGAHAAEHVICGLPFQNNVIDAVFMKELTKQEPRGAGADYDDLRSHISKLGLFGQRCLVSLKVLEQVS
jgi:hypothetical protein